MNNMIITLAKGIVGESNVKTDEPMSSHTTFRVGGAADLYITPQNESCLLYTSPLLFCCFQQNRQPYMQM